MKKKSLQKNREYYNMVINLREKCSSVFIDMLEHAQREYAVGNAWKIVFNKINDCGFGGWSEAVE